MPFATLEDLYGPLGLDGEAMAKLPLGERIAKVEEAVINLDKRIDRFEDSLDVTMRGIHKRLEVMATDLASIKQNGNGSRRKEYLATGGLVGAIVILAQVIDRLVS